MREDVSAQWHTLEVDRRPSTEVAMEATLEWNCNDDVILFLNGLQRAANIYQAESLTGHGKCK